MCDLPEEEQNEYQLWRAWAAARTRAPVPREAELRLPTRAMRESPVEPATAET